MVKKFFLQIVIVALIICFFGLNFDTKVNIKFWFNDSLTLNNISLFISLAVAYLLGFLTFLPMYLAKHFENNKHKKEFKKLEKKSKVELKESVDKDE